MREEAEAASLLDRLLASEPQPAEEDEVDPEADTVPLNLIGTVVAQNISESNEADMSTLLGAHFVG